jgi:hypothetical protein
MTVDLHRYHIARICRKETGLLKNHFLERYLLTSRTGAAGKHYISRQTYHLKFIPLKIAVHLLPCNAMASIKISKRARLSAICTFLFKILIDNRTDMTDASVSGQSLYILKLILESLPHLTLIYTIGFAIGTKRRRLPPCGA